MCLSTIDKKAKLPRGEVFAWKVFETKEGPLTFENFDQKVKLNCWMRAANKAGRGKTIKSSCDGRYRVGFHAFATKEGARTWCGDWYSVVIVRVRLRGVHTAGTQLGYLTYVASKLRVSSRAKRYTKGDCW